MSGCTRRVALASICLDSITAKSAPSFHFNSKLDLGDNLVWPCMPKYHTRSDLQNHPSILEIKKRNQHITFDFSPTTSDAVFKILKTLNIKKLLGPMEFPQFFYNTLAPK